MSLSLYDLNSGKANNNLASAIQNGLMSNTDKAKLDGIENGATNYSHPNTHSVTMITGLAAVATTGNYNDLSNIPTIPTMLPANGGNSDTVDGLHANAFAPVEHVLSGGNTHAAVTTSANGFMIASDKTKLNSISSGAKSVQASLINGNIKIDNTETVVYTHPSMHGNITIDGYIGSTSNQILFTTSLGKITTTTILPIENGGTGASSQAAALNNLGITATSTEINILDGVTGVTSTNINHLSGTTSNIQNQLDSKQPILTGAATTIVSNNLNAYKAVITNEVGKITTAVTSAGELNYLVGANGNIQTQLDGKANSTHLHGNIKNDGSIGTAASKPIITTTNGVLVAGDFGTSAGTFCQGNDSRLSDPRTPLAHAFNGNTYGYATNTDAGHVRIGNGLSIVTGTISVNYGNSSTTACIGNDSRLSDARTPLSHTHGNFANDGSIGTAASKPIITTTNGALVAGDFGTSAGTFCQGNDIRLSNDRNPVSHAFNGSTYGYADTDKAGHVRIGNGLSINTGTVSVNYGNSSTTTCIGNDPRLSDARTPLSHTHSEYLPLSGGTLTGILNGTTIQLSSLTALRAIVTDNSKNLVSSPTTSEQIGFLQNVTSDVQEQLNSTVTGAVSSVTNAICKFDSNTGKVIKNSDFIIDDSQTLILPLNGSIKGTYSTEGDINIITTTDSTIVIGSNNAVIDINISTEVTEEVVSSTKTITMKINGIDCKFLLA